MTLREQVITDLPTFLNVDEFGEAVDIDGSEVICVLDGNGDTEASDEGVINQDTLLYCRAADIERPVVGQRLVIDEEPADVIAVDDHQDMLVIRLRWFDS